MVAAESSPSHPAAALRHDQQEQEKSLTDDGRAPLAVSEKSNGGMRKAKNREITSRYKAASTTSIASSTPSAAGQAPAATHGIQATGASRRHPSPNLGRSLSGDSSIPKRAISAERRRPWPAATPEPKSPASAADGTWQNPKTRIPGRGPELLWPSSQSKLGETSNGLLNENTEAKSQGTPGERRYAPNNTLRPAANGFHRTDSSGVPPQRKGSPMRRQSSDQTENARPDYLRAKPELQRWPGSSNGKVSGSALTRSMDLSADRDRTSVNRSSTFVSQGRTITSSGYGVSSSFGSSAASRPARPTASSLIASAKNFSRSVNEGPLVPAPTPSSRSSTPERRSRSRTIPEPPKNNVQEREKPRSESAASRETPPLVKKLSQDITLAVLDSQSVAVDAISDSESVSSGGSGTGSRPLSSSRGTTVPARVWQGVEASRSRRLSEGNRLRSSMTEQELSTAAKVARKVIASATQSSAHASSSTWSLSSSRPITPISSLQPPSSPARGRSGSSPLRGLPSPTRARPTAPNGTIASRIPTISTLNFGTDLRSRGKKAMSQQEEALLLRILHNRYLQWRFINARADAALQSQRAVAEKAMYSVWTRTSELRALVATQRIKLQQAKHSHKLKTILSVQAPQLQCWSALKHDHATALFGVVEALESSILRVPVTGGARADVQAVKDALGSAVDVMNAVEVSVKNLLPKAQGMGALVAQLAETAGHERALLGECGELLSTAAALEIEERSLTTHLVQVQRERSRLSGVGSGEAVRLSTS